MRGVLAVILSAAKDLFVRRVRPFAALRVTGILSKCLLVPVWNTQNVVVPLAGTRGIATRITLT